MRHYRHKRGVANHNCQRHDHARKQIQLSIAEQLHNICQDVAADKISGIGRFYEMLHLVDQNVQQHYIRLLAKAQRGELHVDNISNKE